MTLVASLLTAAMAAPVLLAPRTRLFGSEIIGRHADPFIVAYLFEHPRGLGLFTQPGTDYLGALIAWVLGDGIAAVNFLTLASFPLAALFAYLLAMRLGGSRPAAWFAGFFYAFAPFHIAQSAYHPHGSQTQWLPLYLLALWLCLERWSPARATLLGLSTGWVVLSNYYYGFIAAVLTPLVIVAFWWALGSRRRHAFRHLAATLATLGALGAGGILYVMRSAPQVLENPKKFSWPYEELLLYGARWWSYLAPPTEHPWWGAWSHQTWGRHALEGLLEQQLTLGLGLIVLAAVAVFAYSRDRRSSALAAVPALAAIAAAAYLLSLAPASEAGIRSWLRPSSLLYEFLPMFRAYARFGVVVLLAVSLLAATGLVWLWRQPRTAARAAAVMLVGLAFVELTPLPPMRWREVLPTSAHRWLSDRSEPIKLMDCVSYRRSAERTVYFRYAPETDLLPGIEDCGDPQFVRRMANGGYTHLVVRGESPLGVWLRERPEPSGLRKVEDFGDALLFEVLEEADPTALDARFVSGFSWREYKDDRSYRWMGDQGSLALTNPSGAVQLATLELELHAFAEPAGIDLLLGSEPVGAFEVGTEIDVYRLGPIRIEPGVHELVLRSREPAVTADSVLANGDPRELSVALWDWRWRPADESK